MTTYYTKDHEWIAVEGDTGTIGITEYAADALGDIVYVDLPDDGAVFKKGENLGAVDSVKTAAEVYAPVSLEITALNAIVQDADQGGEGKPETVNEDATGAGWFCKVKLTNASELSALMDGAAYADYCKGL